MPDFSEYLKQKKFFITRDANKAADPVKFRAPLPYESYDPRYDIPTLIKSNLHNTFAARKYTANKHR